MKKHTLLLVILICLGNANFLFSQCWFVDDATDSVCSTVQNGTLCMPMEYDTPTCPATDGTTPAFVEALAIDPSGSPVYAADDGIVGILDPDTGTFTPLSSACPPLDTGGDIDALAYDSVAGKLYGTFRIGGFDSIFEIDLTTGAVIGTPVVTSDSGATTDVYTNDIDELAIVPPPCADAGLMYASVTLVGGGFGLATVDPVTGVVTVIGPTGVADMESISVTSDCAVVGNTGSGILYELDATTGAAILPAIYDDPLAADVEGMSCQHVTRASLPVELSSFEAEYLGNGEVKLTWTTESEDNSLTFDVERSGADASTYSTRSQIPAAGFSNTTKSYEFIDQINPNLANSNTTLYYRLKMIDQDGVFEYSDIQLVKLRSSNNKLIGYPNPFYDIITIEYHGDNTDKNQLSVYDMFGKKIDGYSIEQQGDVFTLNLAHVPSGQYVVTIETEKEMQRFVVVKAGE